jgi:predicted ester cyclase
MNVSAVKLVPIALTVLACGPAWAQSTAPSLTQAQARAAIAPFYDALNRPATKVVAALIARATGPGYQSCAGNAAPCNSAEKVAGALAGFGKAIPDLQWDIKEVLVAGSKVVVRGEASGTPAGEFFGMPHTGRSFRIMSIDVHTVADGRIVHSHHVEDWAGALRQLSAK